jgi:hypothetical protein
VWLEMIPRKGAANWKRLLPKAGGVIGVASCIMNEDHIDTLLNPPAAPAPHLDTSQSDRVKVEKEEGRSRRREERKTIEKRGENSEDSYAAMMQKIDMDISSNRERQPEGRDLLLSRSFKVRMQWILRPFFVMLPAQYDWLSANYFSVLKIVVSTYALFAFVWKVSSMYRIKSVFSF